MNKKILISLCLLLFPAQFMNSQTPPFDTKEWSRKQYRNEFARISVGQVDQAIENIQHIRNEQPDSLEALFCLAVAYAQQQDFEQALHYVHQALAAGLPIERFLVGPRDLVRPLLQNPDFQKMIVNKPVKLIHGPLLGNVTDSSASFWVRTTEEIPVRIIVSETAEMTAPIQSPIVSTSEQRDFTAVLPVLGLQSDQLCFYQIQIAGEKMPGQWSFRTFPKKGAATQFSIGFGGGAAYTPRHERMWLTIASHQLLAFLFLGDNVYIDNPTDPAVQRYLYYRRQSRPEFRKFTAQTAIYAIWDDHDFTTNDNWGGPAIDTPAWKRSVWHVFQENWNNPYYAGGEAQPGCWFDFAIGAVDFFMLDGRYYRTDPKSEPSSMLGPVQKTWLFEKLKASTAVFKVLVSPVAWASGTKPGSLDTWDGFPDEREEIFAFIAKNRIEGVVLLSADRHRSDVWKIHRPEGYHFYEFESSHLTNIHRHRPIEGALFSYNEKCAFGKLSFDLTRPDPELIFEIISIDNEPVHQFKLRKSQLTLKPPAQLNWEKMLSENYLNHPAFAFVKEDPDLPRVLIIGNSISIGYTANVREQLKGKANVHRIPENAGDTWRGLEKLSSWLGQGHWDVIHFNWGLHDLKHWKNGKLDLSGEQVSTLAEYEKNLETLVTRLKATGAKLIWASTTPVPEGSQGRIKGDDIRFNQVAEKVLERYQRPKNVHFTAEGSEFLGKRVAEVILDMLK